MDTFAKISQGTVEAYTDLDARLNEKVDQIYSDLDGRLADNYTVHREKIECIEVATKTIELKLREIEMQISSMTSRPQQPAGQPQTAPAFGQPLSPTLEDPWARWTQRPQHFQLHGQPGFDSPPPRLTIQPHVQAPRPPPSFGFAAPEPAHQISMPIANPQIYSSPLGAAIHAEHMRGPVGTIKDEFGSKLCKINPSYLTQGRANWMGALNIAEIGGTD